jgi:hypothetical protein
MKKFKNGKFPADNFSFYFEFSSAFKNEFRSTRRFVIFSAITSDHNIFRPFVIFLWFYVGVQKWLYFGSTIIFFKSYIVLFWYFLWITIWKGDKKYSSFQKRLKNSEKYNVSKFHKFLLNIKMKKLSTSNLLEYQEKL